MSLMATPPDQPGFLERFWPHLTASVGGLGLMAIGAADHFVRTVNTWDVQDVSFILIGAGALGVATYAAVKS